MNRQNQCIQELLLKMLKQNPLLKNKPISQNHRQKLKSAMVFDTLIKHNLLEGHTNQDAYNIYCELMKCVGENPISQIDFSRTMCKYYDVDLLSVHESNDSTKRFFVSNKKKFLDGRKVLFGGNRNIHNVKNLVAIMKFCEVYPVEAIVGRKNTEVYADYLAHCKDINQEPVSKIEFGRMLCQYYDIELWSSSKNGRTYRFYRFKGGAAHGDNISGQGKTW